MDVYVQILDTDMQHVKTSFIQSFARSLFCYTVKEVRFEALKTRLF